MSSQKIIGYNFETDPQNGIVYMSVGGCVLSYISMMYNAIILLVLCKPNLRSCSTVLMQGLAIADFFTGFFAYGLEPVFQFNYQTVHTNSYSSKVMLPYPFCALYVYSSQIVDTFHLVSVLFTTCLGIQKVIALKWPILFRNSVTTRSAVVCCVVCFTLSGCICIPRHFAISFVYRENVSFEYWETEMYMIKTLPDGCSPVRESKAAFLYATQYYSLVHAILLVVLSAVMCICVLFTVYRLYHNTFKKRNAVQRLRERRSALMITVVLVIFLISEIPRLLVYGYVFFGKYVYQILEYETKDDSLGWLVTDYRATMAISLKMDFATSFSQLLLIVESLKLVTMLGCMSNFLIYFTMSKQLRMEIRKCVSKK